MRGYIPGYGGFWPSSIFLLVPKFRRRSQCFLWDSSQMLESSVLSKFQLIQNGKTVFPFQDMHLALIPHMWIPRGTNWGDILNPQGGTPTLLIRFKFRRFVDRVQQAFPNLFHSWGPLGYSSCLNILCNRIIDWCLQYRNLIGCKASRKLPLSSDAWLNRDV